ncbi:hypothetical protein, partial [Enterococcus faecium]|uniref:hypothetical protein n=1 Tax=Enterococcus faecium TaxID=1352 RepID=UPI0039083818
MKKIKQRSTKRYPSTKNKNKQTKLAKKITLKKITPKIANDQLKTDIHYNYFDSHHKKNKTNKKKPTKKKKK